MVLIDTLIHKYHWETSSGGGKSGAVGLIEGKMKDIMPFLDELSYGEHLPAGVQATRMEWRRKWNKKAFQESTTRRQREEKAKR